MICKDVGIKQCPHCISNTGIDCWFRMCTDAIQKWSIHFPEASTFNDALKRWLSLFADGSIIGIEYFRQALKLTRPDSLETFDRLAILL